MHRPLRRYTTLWLIPNERVRTWKWRHNPPPLHVLDDLAASFVWSFFCDQRFFAFSTNHHTTDISSRESRCPLEISLWCARHLSLLSDTCRLGTVVVDIFYLVPGNGIIMLRVDGSHSMSRAVCGVDCAVATLKQEGATRRMVLSLGLDQTFQRPCCMMCEHHGTHQ